MGGMGSGNWHRFGTKSTVEDSLTLAVSDFFNRLDSRNRGRFVWTWATGNTFSIGYLIDWGLGIPTVRLRYRWRDGEEVQIPIRMQTTPTNFDGELYRSSKKAHQAERGTGSVEWLQRRIDALEKREGVC